MKEHDGRVCLVTGASSGIGRGAALELARQGGAIVVHGRELSEAQAVVDEILDTGGRAVAVAGPIDEIATSTRAVEAAITAFGRLDTLVTSAGIQRYGDAVETTESTWDEVFAVNVKGVFLAVQASLPWLRSSDSGSIVIVASVQATATQTKVAAYSASKGALLALARAVAVDEAPRGVRVNTVSPGSVDTPMLRAAATRFSDGSPQATERVVAHWGTAHPLGRVATTDEVGAVISFLASQRASFVTGDDVRVDGGLLARLAAPIDHTP
jgi:NAD(P)-dependent dehydrogenase (short-subunit alcohol dehydrogenase family)